MVDDKTAPRHPFDCKVTSGELPAMANFAAFLFPFSSLLLTEIPATMINVFRRVLPKNSAIGGRQENSNDVTTGCNLEKSCRPEGSEETRSAFQPQTSSGHRHSSR